MRKICLVFLALAVCGSHSSIIAPAMAGEVKANQDALPADWTGFYAGVNGGYAWSIDSSLLSYNNVGTFNGVSPRGAFVGGEAGYNWQGKGAQRPLVLGVEVDLQGGDIRDSAVSSTGRGVQYDLRSWGTVRGRIGYSFDQTLLFGSAGFAFGDLDKHTFAGIPTDYAYHATATGYVAGVGLEHKLGSAWSLKAEYQYINLGRNDLLSPDGTNFAASRNLDSGADAFRTVRIGIDYHFDESSQ